MGPNYHYNANYTTIWIRTKDTVGVLNVKWSKPRCSVLPAIDSDLLKLVHLSFLYRFLNLYKNISLRL